MRKGLSWACSASRRGNWHGISLICTSIWRVGARKMGPGSSQWCQALGHKAMDRQWCKGSSILTGRRTSLCKWLCTGTGCPERVWRVPHWRYSRSLCIQSCAMSSWWPCLSKEVGPDVLCGPFQSDPFSSLKWDKSPTSSFKVVDLNGN